MSDAHRVVLDNNVLISGLLLAGSVPAQALQRAVRRGTIVTSRAMLEELAYTLARAKFDRYVSPPARREFFESFLRLADEVAIVTSVNVCRDAKDNRVLEAAINGLADVIITGDEDLLTLHPFHGVRVMRPAAYLAL